VDRLGSIDATSLWVCGVRIPCKVSGRLGLHSACLRSQSWKFADCIPTASDRPSVLSAMEATLSGPIESEAFASARERSQSLTVPSSFTEARVPPGPKAKARTQSVCPPREGNALAREGRASPFDSLPFHSREEGPDDAGLAGTPWSRVTRERPRLDPLPHDDAGMVPGPLVVKRMPSAIASDRAQY